MLNVICSLNPFEFFYFLSKICLIDSAYLLVGLGGTDFLFCYLRMNCFVYQAQINVEMEYLLIVFASEINRQALMILYCV